MTDLVGITQTFFVKYTYIGPYNPILYNKKP